MLEDVLAQSAWCRENSARTDPLVSMSEPPVLAEQKTKLELMCDTRI
jgi:hypothetical protein